MIGIVQKWDRDGRGEYSMSACCVRCEDRLVADGPLFLRLLVVVGLGLAVAGCGGEATPPEAEDATTTRASEQPSAESADTAAEEDAATPAAEVTLDLVDYDGLLEKIASGKGQVVVLDCWSTSCPPCIKEFPGLLELQKTFREEVLCMSLSFDYEGIGDVEEVMPRVRGFLEKVAATIPNMLSKEESDVMLTKLDLVSVPGIFIYGSDGELVKRFDDDMASTELGRPFTYADVEAEVRTLLGK